MARKPGVTAAGVQRRAQILQKAEELIARGGFHEMTMDSIAEALDVSKSSLYHYFRLKEDVLFAIRTETLAGLIAKQRERMQSGRPYIELVREMMQEGLKLVSDSPAKYRAIFELKMKSSTDREAEIRELEREYFHMMVATVQGAIDEGSLRAVDPRLVAQAILSMANHAQYWFKPSGRMSHRAVADAFWDMLSSGIAADDHRGTLDGAKIPRALKVEFSLASESPVP
ncbi:TetR/AcrR family transcriptional regulator [Mycobacterium kyogaense]|uniref:TetR/AcrR family transcriptional regulator n=1 Tax=Mycobacterium kyogaense TaxID=2212479 RepID=UPI0013C4B36E|nr:TetR/AcrR family transcriptional regulator [Mycobacterium kyogaense]